MEIFFTLQNPERVSSTLQRSLDHGLKTANVGMVRFIWLEGI